MRAAAALEHTAPIGAPSHDRSRPRSERCRSKATSVTAELRSGPRAAALNTPARSSMDLLLPKQFCSAFNVIALFLAAAFANEAGELDRGRAAVS
jgi:hypothetical protein